jgi:hypothetical protein
LREILRDIEIEQTSRPPLDREAINAAWPFSDRGEERRQRHDAPVEWLLFSSTPDAMALGRTSTQKQPYIVRMQDAEPRAAKRKCVLSRKTSKPKWPAPTTTPPKDPQSLTAKGN